MVFGVFVAVGLRAFSYESFMHSTCEVHCHDSGDEEHSHNPCDSQEHSGCSESHGPGEECPSGHHHHHGACYHASPLIPMDSTGIRMPVPGSLLLGVNASHPRAPDEPVFELDKPPLI